MNMEGQAVAEIERITLNSATPDELTPGKIYVVADPRNGIKTIDLTGDQYRDRPRRIQETAAVRDVESFLEYWSRHATPDSVVYANEDSRSIVGILDAHGAGDPAWQSHRVKLDLQYTPQFTRWLNNNKQQMDQEAFAEFLEDHRQFVVEPDAATMVELAQSFQATTKAEFAAGFQVQSGQRQLKYTETVAASAGNKGQITIPDMFVLGLPVFKGAQVRDRVVAKLRFRVHSGELRLFYVLDGIEDVIAGAFHDVREQINQGIEQSVINGTAPGR